MPADSWPRTAGVGYGYLPSMKWRSEWQQPAATVLMRTSRGPGLSIWTSSMTSSPGMVCRTAAFMCLPLEWSVMPVSATVASERVVDRSAIEQQVLDDSGEPRRSSHRADRERRVHVAVLDGGARERERVVRRSHVARQLDHGERVGWSGHAGRDGDERRRRR